MKHLLLTIFGTTRRLTKPPVHNVPLPRGIVTLAAACCFFAQVANCQTLGLTPQDHAEVARLGLSSTFSSLGSLLFQSVQIVRARAVAYRGVDREMAECVIRGGSRESCFHWGTALRQRILVEHDEAKQVVLNTCEDAKILPSKLAESSGYTGEDIASTRQLLLKMFAAAGVECHVPAAPAPRFTPVPQTAPEAPSPAALPPAIGSFWNRVFGGEAQHIAWVKEDLLAYIAAARNGFEEFKKGPSFLNEAGQKSWQSKSAPALAKNCRVIQLLAGNPNSFSCILTTNTELEVIRKDYERFVRYIRLTIPNDWEQVSDPLGEVESTGWKSKTGLSGEIFVHLDPERNEYSLCYQMEGLKSPRKTSAPAKKTAPPASRANPSPPAAKPSAATAKPR